MKAVIAVMALLGCGMSFACHGARPGREPEPGTDLFAVAPESISEVLFSSMAHKLFAYRWDSQGRFEVVVTSRQGAAAEQCWGGTEFRRWLGAITRIPVVKKSEMRFESTKGEWAYLELQDTSHLEPIQIRIRVPATDAEPVIIESEGRQYVVGIDAKVLRIAWTACSEPGKRQ